MSGEHVCEHCGREWGSAQALASHARVHNVGDFPCDWPGCDRSFAIVSARSRHITAHKRRARQRGEAAEQRRTAERAAAPPRARVDRRTMRPCPVCTTLMRHDNLRRHIRDVHKLDADAVLHGATSTALVPIEQPSTNGHGFTADIHVDDFVTVVVDALYPAGSLPTSHLPKLLDWRDSTAALIEQAHEPA